LRFSFNAKVCIIIQLQHQLSSIPVSKGLRMGKLTAFKRQLSIKSDYSKNPKTIRNRQAQISKQGLDAALLKADTAFRTAKSRALAKLHKSNGWDAFSAVERESKESQVISDLEQKRDSKKHQHELEWRHLVETGDKQGE
jgi:hypothetical protein